MPSFYEEFAEHCWRFYARNPIIPNANPSDAERRNWEACNAVYSESCNMDREILMSVFTSKQPIAEAVKYTARELGVGENFAWRAIRRATKRLAEKRGLI